MSDQRTGGHPRSTLWKVLFVVNLRARTGLLVPYIYHRGAEDAGKEEGITGKA